MSSTPSPIPAEVLNQMSETDRIRALELLTEELLLKKTLLNL